MGAIVKQATQELPAAMVVFVRNAFGLVALAPWLVRGGCKGLATRCLRLHLLRSLAGLTSMYCFFYALSQLALANAVLLNYSAPLFIPIFALLWLKEPFPMPQRLAAVIGFSGIALILKPDAGLLHPAALIGLTAGIFTALAFVGIRRMAETEPTTRIVFYFGFISTVISALPLPWVWITPRPALLGLLLVMGVLATTAQLLMTRGYALAPAAQVGPFGYTIVIFAALLGWLLWGEVPDARAAWGALLVMGAGVLALQRSTPAHYGKNLRE